MFKLTLKIFTYLVILFVIGFLIKPLAQLTPVKPKILPWQLSVGNAQVYFHDLNSGQILMQISNVMLPDVTPQMLSWFYQNLAFSTAEVDNKKMTWFELFHPLENVAINVLTPLNASTEKNTENAVIQKEQWFGSYARKTNEQTLKINEQGMIISFELAGQEFGRSYHSFIKTKEGIEYNVETLIGSDLPIVGTIINFMLRYKMYPEAMLKHWGKHQVEELNNLNVILPLLFNAQKQHTHYIIKPEDIKQIENKMIH